MYLITGGCGFIGSHTTIELIQNGYDCLIIDNFSNSTDKIISKMENIIKKKIKWERVDMVNKNELESIFARFKIDCVIHFAGLKSVGESQTNPLHYYQNNLISTLNLLEIMQKYNCKKLIFSSSATVYGNSVSPLTENSQTGVGITNPYGQTKYMIERILQDYCKSDKNMRIISLRYFNPIGSHPSGLIGEDPKGYPNNIMPYIMRVALQNNTMHYIDDKYKYVNIFGNTYNTPDGTAIRDYIHVVDLAIGHVKTIGKLKKGYDVFNLGTGKGTSVLELINTFAKANNLVIPFQISKKREGDLETVFCNCQKTNSFMEWNTTKTLEDACKDCWRFQKKYEPKLIVLSK